MAIVINSSTGEIDLDATTPSTYVVTYTVQGVSSTQEVTVNAVDNAGFSYSASSYAPTDADPTPTITGLTGVTFSAGSGLVFVDSGTNTGSSTGEIDLSASTVASYTITYDTTSSGSSVCPNTSTQTVEIAVAGIANNYSMNFDGINDYVATGNTFSELDGGTTMTLSLWIKPITGNSYYMIAHNPRNTTAQQSQFMLWFYSGFLELSLSTRSQHIRANSSAINMDNWNHIACVVDLSTSTKGIIYINGVDETTSVSLTNFNAFEYATGVMRIGEEQTGYLTPFLGSIDEFAIWNTALTSPQIQDIYNATSTNLTKDLSTVAGGPVYWNRMGDN